MKLTLRDYQEQAVEDVRNAYRAFKKAPVLALPTGGGKTVIFSYITERATAIGNKTLILVHRRELVSQSSETLTKLGVDHGIIAAGWKQSDAPVQIASVQTLVRRLNSCTFKPDLIIIDEAHHAAASTWTRVLEHFSSAKRLGVTATPMRLDGKGLGQFFDELVIGPSVAELTEQKHLTPARCFSTPVKLDRKLLTKDHGDYALASTATILEDTKINGNAIKEYKRHCPGKPAIVFCTTKQHAELMAERFRDAGFRSAFLHDGVKATVRRGLIEYLGTGQLDILTSVNVISEGTDIPIVTAAILLRPTESESLYLQQVGRVLRPAPGKEHAIIIDCVGNVQRFGLPADEREYTLDGKVSASAPAVKECPSCYAILPQTTQVCPCCDHIFETKPKHERPKKIIETQLVEVTEVNREALVINKTYTKAEKNALIAGANTLDDFLKLAKLFKFKTGWGYIMWKEKRGIRTPSRNYIGRADSHVSIYGQ